MESGEFDGENSVMDVDVAMETTEDSGGEAGFDVEEVKDEEFSLDMQNDIDNEEGSLGFQPHQDDDHEWQTWRLPEGAVRKRVLQPGEGLYGPGLRAECQVSVQGQCDLDPSQLGYPPGQGTVWLGESATPLAHLLDRAVSVMKRGEVAEVVVTDQQQQGDLTFHITLHNFASATPFWRLMPMEKITAAKEHKERGAQCFKGGNVYAAFSHFRSATRLLQSIDPLFFASEDDATEQTFKQLQCMCRLNLAACQMKTGQHNHVLENCTHALSFDPGNVKALYRRASANVCLGNYILAREDLQEGLRKEPNNRAIVELLQSVNQLIAEAQTDMSSGLRKMFS